MITTGQNGGFVITTSQHFAGEDWLARVKGIINMVKNVDKDFLCKEDIYHALDALEDMLPDAESANIMWKALDKKK